MHLFLRILACSLFLAPSLAAAMTMPPGTYDALDYNGQRSVWTPGGTKNFVSGANVGSKWSMQGGLFTYDGLNASLSGTIVNNGSGTAGDDLQFDVSLSFVQAPAEPGYCQFSGIDKGCTNGPYLADPSTWHYFTLLEGTLQGVVGTAMEGALISLTSVKAHSPQVGWGANALEELDLGFSMWYTWSVDQGPTFTSNYALNSGGNGDFNMDLATAPLPAGGLLLLSALGVTAFSARRRRKAV